MELTHEQALARIHALETTLNQNNTDIAAVFRLTPALANLFGLLVSLPTVTSDMVRQQLNIATDPKVAVHRLRRSLEAYSITIHSKRNIGYWLDPETKERVEGMLGDEDDVTLEGNEEV